MVIMRMPECDAKVGSPYQATSIRHICFTLSSIIVDSTGSTCTYGDVQLVDGSNQYEGRVEVCINDQWGTVCDNSWGTTDATTVCKQLGYAYTSSTISIIHSLIFYVKIILMLFSLAGKAYANAYFGQGTGPIVLDSVQCSSINNKILQCPSNPILQVSSSCGHDDDAAVGCEGGIMSVCFFFNTQSNFIFH